MCIRDRLYFLIQFPPGSAPLSAEAFDGCEAGVPLRFRWFPVVHEELAGLPLMPPFLPQALTELPASLVHLVHQDTAPSS